MNWLAHLYLTPQSPAGHLGALLGDVRRGPIGRDVVPGVGAAIALHRRIDALTVGHPAFRRSCARIDAAHGHWRRVLVDVFYDHVLARTWAEWSREPLGDFLARVHAGLDDLHATVPHELPPFYAAMRAEGWLASYADLEGIAATLRRMRRRLRRDHPLETAVEDLAADPEGFTADFRAFFPAAIEIAAGAARS